MKQTILLTIFMAFLCIIQAQKKVTAYAITGADKNSRNWTEVKLIDVGTGEEIKKIYEASQELPVLNARTGKPVTKNEKGGTGNSKTVAFDGDMTGGDVIIIRKNNEQVLTVIQKGNDGNSDFHSTRKIIINRTGINKDKPFSTKSAACAFDKKHERLYYTPMGINQLRYIDLKSREAKIYYFEEEAFGSVEGLHDVGNQITRMVIASDGNGYALSNNANHLIRFTTNKKSEITDMGALKDDPSNGEHSVHSMKKYGGDMVADNKENLYLITANHHVFKISIKEMNAVYLGEITGLPKGYTTNGAAVEKETSIIVSSANTTSGYYKFDLNSMTAQKLSTAESVFNASDLANGNLLKEKRKKEESKNPSLAERGKTEEITPELTVKYRMSVYPNPVTKGDAFYVRFNDFPYGKYQVQVMDMSGKILKAENVNIGGKMQLHLVSPPKSLAKGTYMVNVVGDANKEKTLATEQILVQ